MAVSCPRATPSLGQKYQARNVNLRARSQLVLGVPACQTQNHWPLGLYSRPIHASQPPSYQDL